MAKRNAPALDGRFLRRAGWMSVAVAGLGGALGAVYLGPRWGAGCLAAGLWSVLNLKALEWIIRRAVAPRERRAPAAEILGLLAVKILVLYGLGAFIVLKGGFPVGSLLVGVSIPLGVIFLKALGSYLAPRVALPESGGDDSNHGR
jgi:hypothetical protein